MSSLVDILTLKTYWKNVSDWVKGTDTVSSPKVTLSGSNALVVKNVKNLNNHIGQVATYQVFIGNDASPATNPSLITPIDISPYKQKLIKVKNGYDVSIKVRFRFYAEKGIGGGDLIELLTPSGGIDTVAAGATMVFDPTNVSKLASRYISMFVEVYSNGTTSPTSGTFEVIVTGGVE